MNKIYNNLISEWKENKLPYILMAPALLVILLITIYPVIRTMWLSLTNYNFIYDKSPTFNGINNYINLFFDDFFREVFLNTVVFSASAVVGTMLIGFLVSLLLNQDFYGKTILSIAILLPWAMPKVAATTLWKWMYNTSYGVLNYLLSSVLNISFFNNFSWLGNELSAFISIGVVVVWQSFPFVAISYLAGLQSIPKQLFEAAKIDGANFWQIVGYIILPMLKNLTLVLLILSTIWDFKVFSQVYVLTRGGPARGTYVLGLYAWIKSFSELEIGEASAIAMIMFFVLILVSILYISILKKKGEI